jgi:hypothetical protein
LVGGKDAYFSVPEMFAKFAIFDPISRSSRVALIRTLALER